MRIRLDRLPDPGLYPTEVTPGVHVVLIRRGQRVTALADSCPHHDMPLSSGVLCEDDSVECPWHGARFSATTGACHRGPATDDVDVFDVRIDGDWVEVRPRA